MFMIMKLKNIFMACIALVASIAFTACQKTEWPDTDPLNKEGVTLAAYGPNPVARGGQLRFVGTGLDQIKSVTIAEGAEITEIQVVNSNDIRIVVPQDAKIGKVVLTTKAGQKIEGSKTLTYTEPVAFAEKDMFSPAKVKPGQELTINGDYLNLVQKIVFTDGVEVADFKEHSREKIVVVVPQEAKTGKVTLSFCATGDTIANEINSKEKLEVVVPSVEEIVKLDGKKPGDAVTLIGKDFDLITAVMSPRNDSIAYTATETTVNFLMPADITDGVISVMTASGVVVPVATVGVALPEELVAAPALNLLPGDLIKITGKNLELVTNVTFPTLKATVDAEVESGRKATEISVKMPAEAVTGEMLLNTAAGFSVPVAYTTQKPVLSGFAPATQSLGGTVVLQGAHMDLVVAVTVTGGAKLDAFDASADAVSITLPYAEAETGTVILHMANGETAEPEQVLTMTAPECCYVTAWPELEDGELLQAGSLLCIEVENRDHLTNVQVDGQECEFLRNGDNKVYISTPASAGKKSHVTLISDNGQIDYEYAFQPNSEVVTILWKGAAALGWSGDGQVYLGTDGAPELIAAGAKAGDQLRIKFAPTADDWCAQIWEGHWGGQFDEIKAENYDMAGNGNCYFITLTDELIATFTTAQGWGGVILCQGQSMIVSELALIQKVAVETTLWKGSAALGWSGDGQVYFMTDGGQEFIDNEVVAGMHLYIYIDALDSWCVQLWEGHWGGQYGEYKGENYDLAGNGGKIDVEITQAMIDAALTPGGWGGILLMQGQDCTVTKITVM